MSVNAKSRPFKRLYDNRYKHKLYCYSGKPCYKSRPYCGGAGQVKAQYLSADKLLEGICKTARYERCRKA